MEVLLRPEFLAVVAYLGMFTHFLKKKVKGETPTEIWKYFHDNVKDTITAIIATFVGFVSYMATIQTGMAADFIVVFGLGYMCDSLFNRWDGNGKTDTAPPTP